MGTRNQAKDMQGAAAAFDFVAPRPARKPSLTPMIDVVFLLLVFFMLAARFGAEAQLPLDLASTSDGAAYRGPPRLIDILPDGVRLNGAAVAPRALARRLAPLTDRADDTLVLRARDGATLQRVVAVAEVLRQAGFTRLVLLE